MCSESVAPGARGGAHLRTSSYYMLAVCLPFSVMPAGMSCSSFICGYATIESLSKDMLRYATFRLMLGKWCKTLIIMRAIRGHNEINQVGDSLPFR